MKSRIGLVLFSGLLLVSCASPLVTPLPSTTFQPFFPSGTDIPASTGVASSLSPDCASEEISQLGASIASSYAFTNQQEVMSWYCAGAEFEDILVALQTEEITGTPAEEMLLMVAEGYSWEDIWQVVGLYDK